MKKRTITSIFIAAFFIGVALASVKIHHLFFDIFVLLAMLLALPEIGRAISKKYAKPFYTLAVFAIIFAYFCFCASNYYYFDGALRGTVLYFLIVTISFLCSIMIAAFGKNYSINNAVSTLLILIYPSAPLIFMSGLNYLPEPYRATAIILLFTAAPFSDIFAYLVGSTVKGKKLCPAVSPKKTISGAIGGLFGGLLGGCFMIMVFFAPWFDGLDIDGMIGEGRTVSIIHCLVLGFGGSVCTQTGDIIASYIKRQCSLKDFGNMLPGHGGVMDRIDGMIVNAVFLFGYMSVLCSI